MNTPLIDQLHAYFDDVDRQQGVVDIDALQFDVAEGVTLIALSSDEAGPPNEPTNDRHWPILAVAAAVVLIVVGAFVVSGEDTQDNAPANPVDTSSTVAWAGGLTVRPLEPAIACNNSARRCPQLAVAPDGTLVGFDPIAETLTWYDDEPRVVSMTANLPRQGGASMGILMAIGPHDIAYLMVPRQIFVAVAPSGAQITRMTWTSSNSNGPVYPTAAGLVPVTFGWPSASTLPTMPWVDLDGNPITDTRPYPTANATDAGIEVRLGEREWLLTRESAESRADLLYFLDFRPRSDGGVVILLPSSTTNAPEIKLVELSPDGTIERYLVDTSQSTQLTILPDGSLIVDRNLELFHLVPPVGGDETPADQPTPLE